MKTTTEEALIEYLEDDIERTIELVQQINAWDGTFEQLEVHEHGEEFFQLFYAHRLDELARAIYYADNYRYDDAYVYINDYGNLSTYSWHEYYDLVRSYIPEIAKYLAETPDVCDNDRELQAIIMQNALAFEEEEA